MGLSSKATSFADSIDEMFGVSPSKSHTSLDSYALSRHRSQRFFGEKRHSCNREFLTLHCMKCGYWHRILSGSKDRTCPACSYELYLRAYRRYKAIMDGCSNLKRLTLTWKPVKRQSADIVRQMGKALIRLFHRKRYSRLWKGILAVVECKKTRSGMFYYHIHCIVSGGYVPQGVISQDWREVSGFPIVDIRRISRTPRRALRYVLKYIMKGALLNPQDRADFKESMKGVRYVRSYGEFYNLKYRTGRHVYFPCPNCGAVKSWVILEYCNIVDLVRDEAYDPP